MRIKTNSWLCIIAIKWDRFQVRKFLSRIPKMLDFHLATKHCINSHLITDYTDMRSQNGLSSRVSCGVGFESQTLLSKAKKRFPMHDTGNVGEEKYCVRRRGDVVVRAKRRYMSLVRKKKFGFTHSVINHSWKPTSFLQKEGKTIIQPTHTGARQSKTCSPSMWVSKELTGKLTFLEIQLQVKDGIKCTLIVSILIWIRVRIIILKHFHWKHDLQTCIGQLQPFHNNGIHHHNTASPRKQKWPFPCKLLPYILKDALYFVGTFWENFHT